MKRITLLLICCLSIATTVSAQKALTVHKGNSTTEDFLTTEIDSIMLSADESIIHIYQANTQTDFLLNEVDSISISAINIPTEGTLDMSQTIPSQILGGNQPYTIYLPPSYNVSPNREYPILYLLHGLGQNYRSWETNGNLKAIADEAITNGTCEEMIIVSPEAYASFYVNGYYQEMNYENYFVNEFIPTIESTYQVRASKGGRSISGLSMGGYGCTYHAFSRPEMFSSCFAMSSAYTGTYTQVGTLVVGKSDEELANFPAFVMECGTEDYAALPMNNNVNNILSQTSLVYTYTTRSGRHDWAFWQECLPKALKLASDNFSTNDEPDNEFGDPSQTNISLWKEGNIPATTSYQTVANSTNPDGADFIPYMVYYPAREGMEVKGAVLICPGGAFQFRSGSEGAPVARALAELGYQAFVVHYRLRPYTQQEGALDLARAVKFVRYHADYYGIDIDNIVVAGFSAGGILCGEQVLYNRGTVNGTSLDNSYVPDALDNVSADVKGIGHIYSFYGRLSVASTDVELFRRSNLPPAFFCYGTNDGFAGQFAACVNALRQAEVEVEDLVLQGMPHGYGSGGNWIPTFDTWLMRLFDYNNN